MAKTILRKTKAKPETKRARPQIGKARESIGGAIGIASLLQASDCEIEGTKGGTLQLAGDALLVLLNRAFDALTPESSGNE
jgi:hypothetical protein